MATSTGTSLPVDLRDRLESVQENMEILYRQIKGSKTTPTSPTPLSGSEFHSKLNSVSQLVSKSCTNAALMFSRLPLPSLSECGKACSQVEKFALQLVNTLYQFSAEQGSSDLCTLFLCIYAQNAGETLCLEVRGSVLNILQDIKKLVQLFIQEGCSRFINTIVLTSLVDKNPDLTQLMWA